MLTPRKQEAEHMSSAETVRPRENTDWDSKSTGKEKDESRPWQEGQMASRFTAKRTERAL